VARGDPFQAAAAALRGGACAIQWRDKLHDKGDQLPVCHRLRELCARHDALFIVNDHADLAAACGADGLHVGQHDLPVAEARRSLAHAQIVGSSNATLAEAQASQDAGADYIAVGAIYPSPSKARTRPAGLETLRRAREIARVPLVAISGINEGNVAEVVAAGADAVAVISAVIAADDPEGAARRLLERIEAARPRLASE
jgi:thiamine-phosphate diphosphorylase